jgi:hypothetical protein
MNSTRPTDARTDWLSNETLQTGFGSFELKGGYPVGDAAERLLPVETMIHAIDVYLMHTGSYSGKP